VPNLLQALRQRAPAVEPARHVTSIDDYLQTINQLEFAYNGINYTPNQLSGLTGTYGQVPHEAISDEFENYCQAAYAANGVVFAVMLARKLAFSAVRFQWQRINKGRPSEMFGSASLGVLEQPWVGGTTQDLLTRVIDDADLAGNSYWIDAAQVERADRLEGVRVPGPQAELVRLRPDWVQVVMEPRMIRGGQVGWRRRGLVYFEGGPYAPTAEPVAFLPDEYVHFAPIPDPLATYRGMSWLTPILREIENDKAMVRYKSAYLRNSATPNLSVSLDKDVSLAAFNAFKSAMDAGHRGTEQAGRTLYLGGGADVKVIGANLQQMDFKHVQGAGETRIAAAGGVPPIIVGLSEGLSSATYSNYSMARRRFADGTMHPLWQNVAGCFANIVPPPPNAGTDVRLWYDSRDVPLLREDQKDASEIQGRQASTINALIMAGFTPESSVAATSAEDWDLLDHTGLVSVQLLPPGTTTGNKPVVSNAEPAKTEPAAAKPTTQKPEVTDG
jgi:phage portal protein BeeE